MFRGCTFALLALLVAGCATMDEMREDKLYASYTTSKPAKQVAECIRDEWMRKKYVGSPMSAVLQESPDRYTVTSPGVGSPVEFVDVLKDGHIKQYTMTAIFKGRKELMANAVTTCL